MGAKITGIHAIEEALRSAPRGSTLYLLRGDKRNSKLELEAMANGKTAVKKVSDVEMDRLAGGSDHRGAVLDLGAKSASSQGGRIRELLEDVQLLRKVRDRRHGDVLRSTRRYADYRLVGACTPSFRDNDQGSGELVRTPQDSTKIVWVRYLVKGEHKHIVVILEPLAEVVDANLPYPAALA